MVSTKSSCKNAPTAITDDILFETGDPRKHEQISVHVGEMFLSTAYLNSFPHTVN